jgi:hypothetical protein
MDPRISAKIRPISALTAGIVFCWLLSAGTVLADKVYRWVDENGEIHYSETLPPDIEDTEHDVLDEQGIIRQEDMSLKPEPVKVVPDIQEGELPRDASGMKRAKPLYSEQELQNRMDRLLLLRYDSEDEIIDAMEVEINQLSYDRRLLETSRDSLAAAYKGNIHEAADRQRAGATVEPELANTLADLRVRIDRNSRSMQGLKKRENDIRILFESDLERYRKLIAEWEEQNP